METVKSVKQRTIEAFSLGNIRDILEEKDWGCKFSPKHDVHICYILKGGYCSWHHHNFLINHFTCLYGQIDIQYEDHKLDQTDFICLMPGETFSILPRANHRFQVQMDSILFETYDIGTVYDDIIRIREGGINNV